MGNATFLKKYKRVLLFSILALAVLGFIFHNLFFVQKSHETMANPIQPMDINTRTSTNTNTNKVKGRGYCSEHDEYVLPEIHADFISKNECDHILRIATPEFRESRVVTGVDTKIRKSQTAWLKRDEPVIASIIQRVCDLTGMPFAHAEKMQVVKYGVDGYYNEHYDAACDDRQECVDFEKNGGQRKITMLLYLSDNFEGGGTRFPRLNKEYKLPKHSGILFHSLQKNGNKCHPLSLHAGLPVISGEKYIANVWLREFPYDVNR